MSNIYNAIQNLYNMDKTTWQEVLAEMYNLVSNVENKFDLFENKFGSLLGKDVTRELKKMYNDGSLAALINDKILKDIKREFSEQLDTKANEDDLNTLENRMNSFTKLLEGSTTGDAELIDGRVGANGEVYENIGTAIRQQFTSINEKLLVNKSLNLFNKEKVIYNSFKSGEVGQVPTLKPNNSFANYTLKVKMGEKYIVSGTSFSVLCLNSDGEIITKKSSPSADKPNYIINVDYPNTNSIIINFKPSSFPIDTYMILNSETMSTDYIPYFEPFYTFSGHQFYVNKDEFSKYVDNVTIIEKYTVGTGKDYETFTECIRALKDNKNKKEIIIDGGVYDIFSEIGGSEYALSIEEGSNWYDVCDIVPPNTKIIGKGNVIFNFEPTADEIGTIACKLLSPINVRGTCTIENITINADNCRYCIHDETSGDIQFEGAIKIYKNVIANKRSSGSVGYAQAYASGFDDNMKFIFDNCTFTSDNLAFSVHNRDTTNENKSSRLEFNNCKFISGNSTTISVRLGNINWRQENIKVDINNSYLNKKIAIYNESGYGKKNGYNLTMCGCNDVEISVTTDTNIYEPKIYKL